MDQKMISRILILLSFIFFVIAAIQAEYATVQPWLVPGGLAAFALSFLIA